MVRELEVGRLYLIFTVKVGENAKRKNVGNNKGKYLVVGRNNYEYKVKFCGVPAENVEVMTTIGVADLICGCVCAYPAEDGSVDSAEIPHE